jgi:hypothetical protein
MADDFESMSPEYQRRYFEAVKKEAEDQLAKAEADAARPRSNVRQLRPRAVAGSQPVPLEPESTTDEWESWWLPEPVQAWVDACAAAYCVPKVMPIAAALCAASLLVQGKAKVRIHEAWEEELSLYWLVFAPTGMAKSAVLKAAMAPVRALQRSAEEEMLPVIRERANERARLEAQISRMRRATKAHRYSEGAQEHLQQLRELEHELAECEVPVPPKWLHTDANPTVIPRLMAHNLAAEGIARVAVCDAEGTFVSNLLGRHSGHLNVDPLLAAYTGDPIEMVRTAPNSTTLQEFRMASSHMVMCLMVQPHYLDKLRAHPELGDNGWMGRCLISKVNRDPMPEPFRRPAIPDEVSEGYADWLARLAAVEPGTVYDMPAECQVELERMHCVITEGIRLSDGAVGWSARSLGRICRIFALIHMVDGTVRTVRTVRESETGPGGRACRVLNLLYTTIYTHGIIRARSLEPARAALPTHARRALSWFRRCNRLTVTLRDLQRALTVSKEDALATCDLLCESGHLELADEKRRGNQTLTLTYNVVSTDPDCGRAEGDHS